MRIEEMNWGQVEDLVKIEKRAVLPLGSVEQHAQLSLAVDMILAHKVAVEAAEPLNIPVYPVLPYGVAPYFSAYPGTVVLKMETYLRVVGDILASLYRSGHRKILIVNGHGGNSFVAGFAQEWSMHHQDALIKVHDWWAAPKTWELVQQIEQGSSHASWMENFPWTEIAGVEYERTTSQEPLDKNTLRQLSHTAAREFIGKGNFGGREQRDKELMQTIWDVAVTETRNVLENDWADKYLQTD